MEAKQKKRLHCLCLFIGALFFSVYLFSIFSSEKRYLEKVISSEISAVENDLSFVSEMEYLKKALALGAALSIESLVKQFIDSRHILEAAIVFDQKNNNIIAHTSKSDKYSWSNFQEIDLNQSLDHQENILLSIPIDAHFTLMVVVNKNLLLGKFSAAKSFEYKDKKVFSKINYTEILSQNIMPLTILLIISSIFAWLLFEIVSFTIIGSKTVKSLASGKGFYTPEQLTLFSGPLKSLQDASKAFEDNAKRTEGVVLSARQIAHDVLATFDIMEFLMGTVEELLENKEISDRIEQHYIADIDVYSSSLRENMLFSRAILDDLQNLEKTEVLHRESIDIKETISDCVTRITNQIASPLRIDLGLEHSGFALVDKKINRVFFNLIKNAIDETLYEGLTWVKSRDNGAFIEITVGNNGREIPEDIRNTLFLKNCSDKKQGHGLGLSVVHKILSAHQVEIAVFSNQEKTEFRFSLPRSAT